MKLVSADGTEFELEILGYESPEVHVGEDANWLVARICVKSSFGQWEASAPCLRTWEAKRLAKWLHAIGRSRAVDNEEYFLEPNLMFQLIANNENGVIIKVFFELELRPPWAPADSAGMEDLFIILHVTRIQLLEAVKSLRSELAKFPVRGSLFGYSPATSKEERR